MVKQKGQGPYFAGLFDVALHFLSLFLEKLGAFAWIKVCHASIGPLIML